MPVRAVGFAVASLGPRTPRWRLGRPVALTAYSIGVRTHANVQSTRAGRRAAVRGLRTSLGFPGRGRFLTNLSSGDGDMSPSAPTAWRTCLSGGPTAIARRTRASLTQGEPRVRPLRQSRATAGPPRIGAGDCAGPVVERASPVRSPAGDRHRAAVRRPRGRRRGRGRDGGRSVAEPDPDPGRHHGAGQRRLGHRPRRPTPRPPPRPRAPRRTAATPARATAPTWAAARAPTRAPRAPATAPTRRPSRAPTRPSV